MNILITGGLGHIGSQLIRQLPLNYKIKVVDNLLTQRYCSLFDLDNPIIFSNKDINQISIEDLEKADIVIHLAAITNAEGSFENKKETEKINTELTSNFIDKCEQAGCKFLFPSSTSVYGMATDIVYEDDDTFLNPQSPYAETKINIEKKLKNYKNDYVILRFGTIFGSSVGMRFHTAINKFCYEASIGKPLTIWRENFDQYRPYLGLNDAIRSIIFFLMTKKVWNETYNVLTDNFKLCDIVDYIQTNTGITVDMVNTPLLNQFSYKVSDEKIKALGFKPEDDLFKSIDNTLYKLRNLVDQQIVETNE